MKDHEKAELVNKLRDTAIAFHDSQQLRSRIQDVLLPALAASGGNAAPELPSLPSGVAATERMRSYAIEYGKACHAAGRGAAVREYIDNGTFKDVAAPNAALVEESINKVLKHNQIQDGVLRADLFAAIQQINRKE